MFAFVVGVVAGVVGCLAAVAPLLQARKIRSLGTSEGVSMGALAVQGSGRLLWAVYGLATGDAVLATPNGLGAIVAALALWVAFRHRPERPDAVER
jgi:uncharacterized protein with PQ loop repeat